MATKFKQNLNITGTINATAFTGDGSSLTGVSGSPLTIQDEGSALSTAATTLNFVGAGVTASGTGATKTITISGGGGGGGISNIVEDTTPQLGGNLDAQAFDITTTGKILYANMYATEGDLPNATTYHGMFAHVHATGAGYFAHGGNWIKLANDSQLSSYQTTAGLNGAIDTHLNQTNPTSGHVLSWNGSDYAWVANSGGGGGSTNPAGANTQVQYNNNGSFGAESDFTYNASTNTLSVVNLTATNITTTGSGSTTVTAGANIELNATNRVLVTDTPFRLASFTTTQRDAISSPVNGDMIYNSTLNQLESYENGSWGATAGSGGGGSGDITSVTITAGTGLSGTTATTTGAHVQTLSVNASQTQITSVGTLTGLNVSGASVLSSTLRCVGNFDVNTNRFVVNASNGNTYIDGTLTVGGEVNLGTNNINAQFGTFSGDVTAGYGSSGSLIGDAVRLNVNGAVYFEGTAQNAFQIQLQAINPTADRIINLPDAAGTVGLIGDPVSHTFNVTNNGASDYTFSDTANHWFPSSENDPVLYLRRGETYNFVVNASGHPFEIRQGPGANIYNTGVTNNTTASGTIIFKVPMSAPATLYYQCTIHSGMGNTINIV